MENKMYTGIYFISANPLFLPSLHIYSENILIVQV